MFHSSEALAKKTPAGSLTRPAFLQSLVDEYQAKDTSPERRTKILASLGNFAYDPINYAWLRELNVVDLFLDCLPTENVANRRHAIAGLCNLSLDPKNRDLILKDTKTENVVLILTHCLVSTDVDTVQSAMTCLSNLTTTRNKDDIQARFPQIRPLMETLSTAKNPVTSNLAKVYLLENP
ncbi:Armadillo repeat-containing protein 7 [Podila minutissima]|uniref:Armadillo repeat-containing protein 7 n=1 Tax=Podila minutissima TaxID=64525 RepID=A0A9P5ST74_9FUNG|nr:Armadillo repeat-containing protein 7 [Podila minutissima]